MQKNPNKLIKLKKLNCEKKLNKPFRKKKQFDLVQF